MCKGVVNGIWESGWSSECSLDEAQQVVNDIEKLVLSGLIEEDTSQRNGEQKVCWECHYCDHFKSLIFNEDEKLQIVMKLLWCYLDFIAFLVCLCIFVVVSI